MSLDGLPTVIWNSPDADVRKGRYSTALPSALALAAGWSAHLARDYGALIGRELAGQGYNISLGGGVNITREARNGRNFEYLGEDLDAAIRSPARRRLPARPPDRFGRPHSPTNRSK